MDKAPTSTKNLVTFHQLHVEIVTKADEELLEHLEKTILGTPGGLKYQHTNISNKLENIGKIYFMLLRKSGHLLGSVGIADRSTTAGTETCQSWYVRYFSIKAPPPFKESQTGKRSQGCQTECGYTEIGCSAIFR